MCAALEYLAISFLKLVSFEFSSADVERNLFSKSHLQIFKKHCNIFSDMHITL